MCSNRRRPTAKAVTAGGSPENLRREGHAGLSNATGLDIWQSIGKELGSERLSLTSEKHNGRAAAQTTEMRGPVEARTVTLTGACVADGTAAGSEPPRAVLPAGALASSSATAAPGTSCGSNSAAVSGFTLVAPPASRPIGADGLRQELEVQRGGQFSFRAGNAALACELY